ncbi:MAG TPA: hypothetical protein VGO90_06015 [Chthoniobacteraceae bacterium]|jgi:hypothetical protein|nr:hypothetical protein [Chthoniobacteraceae bacterium]
MRCAKTLSFAALLGFLVLAAGTQSAEAAIHIYKVTFSGKAQFFPKPEPIGNSLKSMGYLIYDTNAPANSQTVEIFSNKTYRVNGLLLQLIFPSQIGLAAIDRDEDGFNETASALVGFQNGNTTVARSYIGAVPKSPFSINGVTFINTSKALKGKGSVVTAGLDLFTVTDSWKFDSLSALPGVATSNNSNDGVTAVIVYLQGKGYQAAPAP